MRFLSLFIIIFSISIFPALAEDIKPEPLRSLPTNLELPDQKGKVRSFDDLKGLNGLVVVFFRSAEWCPYCQVQLMELQVRRTDIEELGYNIVGISYDNLHVLDLFTTRKHITYPLLSDLKSEHIRAFGILNEKLSKNHKAYGVPHPTVYIVNGEKEIISEMKEEGFKKRPLIDDIVKTIRAYEFEEN